VPAPMSLQKKKGGETAGLSVVPTRAEGDRKRGKSRERKKKANPGKKEDHVDQKHEVPEKNVAMTIIGGNREGVRQNLSWYGTGSQL